MLIKGPGNVVGRADDKTSQPTNNTRKYYCSTTVGVYYSCKVGH